MALSTLGSSLVCKHLVEQPRKTESGVGVMPQQVTVHPAHGQRSAALPLHTRDRVVWAQPPADGHPSRTIGGVLGRPPDEALGGQAGKHVCTGRPALARLGLASPLLQWLAQHSHRAWWQSRWRQTVNSILVVEAAQSYHCTHRPPGVCSPAGASPTHTVPG